MQFRSAILATVILAALAGPTSVLGQFQQPTDEELKMTSEPKVPGAAAIYLYSEETADDNLHFHSVYERIKVLTEKGKELATVSIPYEKGQFVITDIKGRTIHADGTVIPLEVKPTDQVEQKGKGFQFNKMVFTLPSVEVGSILEYRWQIRYDDERLQSPEWEVQRHYYVRKAHYSFVPFRFMDRVTDSKGNASSKLLYSSVLPKDVKVNREANGRYVLDVADVMPIPHEEYMPPIGTLVEQVEFYYSPYTTKDEYWKKEGERWSKEMDRFAGEGKGLRGAVNELVQPGDSEDVKARKLYEAVQKLENTDYTRKKSAAELKQLGLKRAKDAEDVWLQRSGTSDEIALTYLALARAAGLKAYAMTTCNRNRAVFSEYYLSMNQFDDVLVIVTVNGKEVPVDPGEKFAVFGELNWRHALVSTMRQTDKGTEFGSTPAISYKQATTLRVADLTVERDGTVSGTVRFSMSGPAAMEWRQKALENDEIEVKKSFDEMMKKLVPDGVTADFDHFLGLEDPHLQLMGVVKISGNLGTTTGKRLFLPGAFFESRSKLPFVAEEKRETAVDMRYADSVRDEVTYHLPAGFTVESAPADTQIPWTGRGVFALKSIPAKDSVTVARSFVRGFSIVAASEYGQLREFYQKMSTADQQQLVLTMTGKADASGAGYR